MLSRDNCERIENHSMSKKLHPKQQAQPAKKQAPQAQQMLSTGMALVVVAIAGLMLAFNSGLLGPQGAAEVVPETSAEGQPSYMVDAPQNIQPQAYVDTFAEGEVDHILVDVRTPREFDGGHIAGAVNIPLDEIPQRLAEFPQDKPIVLYCRSGNRSGQAMSLLDREGYDGLYNIGGVIHWTAAGLPLE